MKTLVALILCFVTVPLFGTEPITPAAPIMFTIQGQDCPDGYCPVVQPFRQVTRSRSSTRTPLFGIGQKVQAVAPVQRVRETTFEILSAPAEVVAAAASVPW